MSLKECYRNIKKSIVAFIPKYTMHRKLEDVPPYPPIIGTGFVVRDDGLIVTNAHVVRAFKNIPKPPSVPVEEWPVSVLIFKNIDAGLAEIPLDILEIIVIKKFIPSGYYYGPKDGPDIAFVHVKARKLPSVEFDSSSKVEEGTEVATAGFPMGSDALLAPGWLHQIAPTLQSGIISAVQPFESSVPHSFAVNIMAQGGASGSPVFSCETGKVLGILYSGLLDFKKLQLSDDTNATYAVPTNISYVVPSHFILKSLDDITEMGLELPPDAKTIDERIAETEPINVFEKGRQIHIKKIDLNEKLSRQLDIIVPDQKEGEE